MNTKSTIVKKHKHSSLFIFEPTDVLRPIDKIRYWIYRLTDCNPNRHSFSVWLVLSLIYNIVLSLLPAIAIMPILLNYIVIPANQEQYVHFNQMMAKYMYVEYVFCFMILIDWLVRLTYCDYKYTFVTARYKAIFVYCTRPYNLYQLSSMVVLICLFAIYGNVLDHNWYIDLNVLGSHYSYEASATEALKQYNAWNPGELIFVTLYIVNIIGIVPRLVLAFKEQPIIRSKAGLWAVIKKRWKAPVIATAFLIVLLFIFSFLILKTEQSYYSEWAAAHPDQPIDNAPNYSSSPKNIGQSLWYCLITITTVGYGQIIPQSPAGRVIAVFLIIFGLSYYSFYTVFFVSSYTKFLDKKDQELQDQQDLLQKKQDQEQLVAAIKTEFISDLLKYGVISSENYQKVQQQEMQALENKKQLQSKWANKQAEKLFANNNHMVEYESFKLTNWLNNKFNWTGNHHKESMIIKKNELLDPHFDYTIIQQPNLNENYQTVLIRVDSNIVRKIFNNQVDDQLKFFFAKAAAIYKINRVVIADRILNTAVGEVSIKDVLLTTPEIAWKTYGQQSGWTQSLFDTEFGDQPLVYIYEIVARRLYDTPYSLANANLNPNVNMIIYLRKAVTTIDPDANAMTSDSSSADGSVPDTLSD